MLETFLTAYDPSDLPGTSIDPLGFERGYLFLADKILPGLTNVASHPRYFGLICAGVYLSGAAAELPERELRRKRQETILRLERFWALANVLARPSDSNAVRGVTYAQARVEELVRASATRTTNNYLLLSRQAQYGAIGIYANVADGMRFLNRTDLTLTPAIGELAGQAFVRETELPSSVRKAIVDDGDVSLATLKSWGERAHVDREANEAEAKCLLEALNCNSIRSRMAELLRRNPWRNGEDTELGRLARILPKLNGKPQNRDIREAIECILAFERCYGSASLAFERLLWLCRHHTAASVNFDELKCDHVLATAMKSLPASTLAFLDAVKNGTAPEFRAAIERLSDVGKFLEAASTANNTEAFVRTLIARHADVQHGKFDKGRRKMPWLETKANRIYLTMTRVGGLNWEATLPEHIMPHPYRLGAADALILASGKARTYLINTETGLTL
jgi:hypothetical protein